MVEKLRCRRTRRCVIAKAGDEIVNPRTGQRMVFLETGEESDGPLLRIDSYHPPPGGPEPEHAPPLPRGTEGGLPRDRRGERGAVATHRLLQPARRWPRA